MTMMHPSFQECTWINPHAISGVNLPVAFSRGGTPFGLNPLQAPTRVGKKNNRQQKNHKKKKSTSRMKAISNYVPALRIMQQDKTAANPNPPKTNQHEENCYKVDGYKSNHYRKHCSRIIQSVRKFVLTAVVDKWTSQKKIQQEPAQGRKVLVENRQQNESCIKLCTCSKNNAAR